MKKKLDKQKSWAFTILFCLSIFINNSCGDVKDESGAMFIDATLSNNLYPQKVKDLILLSTVCDDEYCLSALSPIEKKVIWSYTDIDGQLGKQYTNINFYSYDHFTAIPLIDQVLVINNQSGEHLDTLDIQGQVASNLFGVGRYVYPVVRDSNSTNLYILTYDFIQENIDTSISLNIPNDEIIISIGPIVSPIDSTILYNSILRYRPSDNKTQNYLLKWGRERGIIDSISLADTNFKGLGVTRPPIIDTINGISYWHLTDAIVAFNHHDDSVMWLKDIGQVSLVSRPVFFAENIIYPTEANFFLVIDKVSGNIIDTVRNTPSFPGRISVLKDKMLFVGGVDGHLYSLERGTDDTIFDLKRFPMKFERLLSHQNLITNNHFIIHDGGQWIISNLENLARLEIILGSGGD